MGIVEMTYLCRVQVDDQVEEFEVRAPTPKEAAERATLMSDWGPGASTAVEVLETRNHGRFIVEVSKKASASPVDG